MLNHIQRVQQRIRDRGGNFSYGAYDPTQLKNALPTFNFEAAKFQNCGAENKDRIECRICMMDFEEDDELRQMQCFHHFHKTCIDKWLESSKKCPLCNHK